MPRLKGSYVIRWLGVGALLWPGFPLEMAHASPPVGLAFQTFDLTLEPGTRTEIAGPLYYRQQLGTELTQAWPPLFSHCTDPSLEYRGG